MTRRHAIGALAAPFAARLRAAPLGIPIGFQIYPVRSEIVKDFEGLMRRMALAGYQAVELCSPMGYGAAFAPLAAMKPKDLRNLLHTIGLRCESCHFQFREVRDNLAETVAWAKEAGLRQMIIASYGLRKDATMDDWRRAADESNKIGEETLKAGLQLGFHNHAGEFMEIDGVLIYDELLRRMDAKLVKMQFQVSVVSLGFHAATYFDQHPGRFISIHLQDYSPETKRTVAIGKGSVDWKKLFTAARTGGVKNYFVEVSPDLMLDSVGFLRDLKV
jgi:sugar phosphate isomerase/epimerase